MKKWKTKRKRDKYKIQKKIKIMRRIVEWAENARIQEERGKKIKRWERGNRMIREAKAEAWLGKKIREVETEELHRKAEEHLRDLIRKRDEADEREKRLKNNLEKMKRIDEDERGTKYFYKKVKMENKKECIEELTREENSDEEEKDEEDEKWKTTSEIEKMKEIAHNFYDNLWKKRRTSNRKQGELLNRVKRKISQEERDSCEGKITEEEVAQTKKKMTKGKATGIDGLPIEFWQTFDFTDDWLQKVFNETRTRKKMTKTMRLAVVKIIYKKGDKDKMSNYRPISLLCADYKLFAKIITNRMRPVLNSIIQQDQQGFIKEGDIMGNLILVKEIIQYCNEEDVEGALILMDFKKAYDRVDRDLMIKTLERMNFGPEFTEMIATLYEEVGSMIEVNDELTREVITGGGVRQGCPLSPFLFICVLELMAIAVRENENIRGIREPETKEEDKISLFADDSCICLSNPFEHLKEARYTMKKYEDASGSALHEGKTMIMKIGKTRKKKMTNKQVGVNFTILKDDDREKYLGDMIGNDVKEEERFEKNTGKMEKIGYRWDREKVTVYGRALISNTLMVPVILYKGRVNGMTMKLKKQITKIVKDFVWRDVQPLQWKLALRPIDKGGIGVKDPICIVDATRIKLIKDMIEKNTQPWVKWMKRKEKRITERWQVKNIFQKGMKKKNVTELSEECIFESAVKIWHEMKGKIIEEGGEEVMMICTDGEWQRVIDTTGKEIYAELVRIRFGKVKENEENDRVNHTMTTIAKGLLTPQLKQFWWKVAHKKIMTNNRAHKWKLNNRGRAPNECNVCHKTIENWEHMEDGCEGVKEWRERLKKIHEKHWGDQREKWQKMTREDWRLSMKSQDLTLRQMWTIAVGRWIFHKERSRLIHRQRRRIDMDRMQEEMEDELRVMNEKLQKELQKQDRRKEKEEEQRKKRQQAKENGGARRRVGQGPGVQPEEEGWFW